MAITRDVSKALNRLSKKHGIHRGELRLRFHLIKQQGSTPLPADTNWIDDGNGNVYDGSEGNRPGTYIGNVLHDF